MMGYLVAKENPKTPEGWAYFKEYETIDGVTIPINTIIREHARVFGTKEEAAKAYWLISHYFYGYRIYTETDVRAK